MSSTIPIAAVEEFNSAVHHLAQLKVNKLRGTIPEVPVQGKARFIERIGAVNMSTVTGRRQDTEYTDTPHSRRQLTTTRASVADTVDDIDTVRHIIDPVGEYAREFAWAAIRRVDQVIIDAADGNATSVDEDGTTSTVALGSGQKVAVDYVATGSTADSNLTVAKVRKAAEILNSNDVPPEDRWAIIGPNQLEALQRDSDFTSIDTNAMKPLVGGGVENVFWMGFTWRTSTQLAVDASNVRDCLFYHRSALRLGVAREVFTLVDRIPLKEQMVQIYTGLEVGATRIEEEGVVQVKADEDK